MAKNRLNFVTKVFFDLGSWVKKLIKISPFTPLQRAHEFIENKMKAWVVLGEIDSGAAAQKKALRGYGLGLTQKKRLIPPGARIGVARMGCQQAS